MLAFPREKRDSTECIARYFGTLVTGIFLGFLISISLSYDTHLQLLSSTNFLSIYNQNLGNWTTEDYKHYFQRNLKFQGCMDVDVMIPTLRHVFDITRNWILVDIGANVGATTASFVNTFGDLQRRKYRKHFGGRQLMVCQEEVPLLRVYCFEPHPLNLERIIERFKKFDYHEENITIVNKAVSDFVGETQFFARGVQGWEQGSLGGVKHKSKWPTYNISVTKIDAYFAKEIIFLLKIDAEKHDPYVLFGSELALREKRVFFIIFELNPYFQKYRDLDIDLKYIVDWLYRLEYWCFLITDEMLIPLSDGWMPYSMPEPIHWSNVFCSQVNDMLLRVFEIYHIENPILRSWMKYLSDE